MRFATKLPSNMKQWFNVIASFAHLDTTGVTLRLMKNPARAGHAGEACGNTVRLPYPQDFGYDYSQYGRSFLHELQHVVDTITNVSYDLTENQIESRARKAERLVDEDTMRSLAATFRLHRA